MGIRPRNAPFNLHWMSDRLLIEMPRLRNSHTPTGIIEMKSLTSFFPDCDEAEKKGKDK
jgi:hypothetical protein